MSASTRNPTHDLIDFSCVVGITAVAKQQDSVGNYFVLLDLELAPRPIVSSAAPVGATQTDKFQVELTLPQFYHLLSEMEECKATLASSD